MPQTPVLPLNLLHVGVCSLDQGFALFKQNAPRRGSAGSYGANDSIRFFVWNNFRGFTGIGLCRLSFQQYGRLRRLFAAYVLPMCEYRTSYVIFSLEQLLVWATALLQNVKKIHVDRL